MKIKRIKNQKHVGKTEIQKLDEWWAKLAPADKQLAYELGVITQAFKGGLAKNVLCSAADAERAVEKLMKGAGAVYDKVAPGWPANKAETRGLN
jgi:hypothetical protein